MNRDAKIQFVYTCTSKNKIFVKYICRWCLNVVAKVGEMEDE